MNYQEALDFLFNQTPVFQHTGANAYKPGLQNILELDQRFHSPHESYPTIHIGGTNGKGSVSNLIASILQESGYRVGLYTSPHLKDFRERIRVNGEMVSEGFVSEFVTDFRENGKEMEPSFFELTTEMAFKWFEIEKVDVAIIEVGLGGRLDSTNIIRPIVSVITNISLDHTALLGDTLDKIAFEKAGIMKKNIPVVIGKAEGIVRAVFEKQAAQIGTKLFFAENEFKTVLSTDNQNNTLIQFEQSIHLYNDIECALDGSYQQENATTVLSLVEQLRSMKWNIKDASVYRGFWNVLKNTGLRGRWETLSKNPYVLCDTGHNVAGIKHIVEQLRRTPHDKLHFVIGVVSDKDVSGILHLLPKDALYYFTKATIARALDEKVLESIASKEGLKGNTFATVEEALTAAKKNCRSNDLVFVGGSTFIVAEAL